MEHVVGNERFFDPEDIFFSVTDAKGVITRSNSTFVQLSAFGRDELIGAPHNLIRHDTMPAGAFKLMWDDLSQGLPVCAYVVNKANDDLDYRVFAVVVPVGEDYLSVRMKPQNDEVRTLVESVYETVRAEERRVAGEGASRYEVGVYGAGELAAALAPLGFGSLYDMTQALLPTELQLLLGAGVRVPETPEATGPLGRILEVVRTVERDSDALVRQLDEYSRLLGALDARSSEMADMSQRARDVIAGVSSVGSPDSDSSAPRTSERVVTALSSAVEILGSLPTEMDELRREVVRLRFLASQMRLLTLMVGRFAASAVHDGEEDALASMTLLCRALEEGTGSLADTSAAVRTGVAELDVHTRALVKDLDSTQRPLDRWLRTLRDEGAVPLTADAPPTGDSESEEPAAEEVPAAEPAAEEQSGDAVDCETVIVRVEALAQQGFPEAGPMAALAAECRGLELPIDKDAFDAGFRVLHDELEAYTGVTQDTQD
ncbi:MAG: diguanylate cyclase [Actinomyces sp.]|uniref:diguanylate cyclase n=1 Tax=Actinomyces sp. TaxID=29317 RepID=UPI0026DD9296|nr:diguanylate cyclase [Actinomyces sp.]MDO4243694.1 diguanylate cyclase [Actinomyces sp.]